MSDDRPTGSATPPSADPGWFRALARRLHGVHAALGLYLTVGLATSALALWGFAELADEVAAGTTRAFDRALLRWLDANSPSWLTGVAVDVTQLGSGIVLAMLVLLASAFLWSVRHRAAVALLWVALAGQGVLNRVLKATFDRPRPDVFPWRVEHVSHASFPSGHSMGAMVAYTTLAWAVTRVEPEGPLRPLTWGVAALAVALVGWSRMHLGVHYPTDVVAGFAVGFAWSVICICGLRLLERARRGGAPGDSARPGA